MLKEDSFNSILQTPKFKEAFINDVVNNFKTKIRLNSSDILNASINDEDIIHGKEPLNIDYSTKIKYIAANNEYIPLGISIDGENIYYKLGSSYNAGDNLTPPESDVWFTTLDWTDIVVKLYNEDWDVIDENLLLNKNDEISRKFILNFISPYLTIGFK